MDSSPSRRTESRRTIGSMLEAGDSHARPPSFLPQISGATTPAFGSALGVWLRLLLYSPAQRCLAAAARPALHLSCDGSAKKRGVSPGSWPVLFSPIPASSAPLDLHHHHCRRRRRRRHLLIVLPSLPSRLITSTSRRPPPPGLPTPPSTRPSVCLWYPTLPDLGELQSSCATLEINNNKQSRRHDNNNGCTRHQLLSTACPSSLRPHGASATKLSSPAGPPSPAPCASPVHGTLRLRAASTAARTSSVRRGPIVIRFWPRAACTRPRCSPWSRRWLHVHLGHAGRTALVARPASRPQLLGTRLATHAVRLGRLLSLPPPPDTP